MKKIFILVIVVSALFVNIEAQITGGGNKTNTPTNTKQAAKKGVFDRVGYFTLRSISPLGDLKEYSGDIIDDIETNGSPGMRTGFGLNLGKIFYLNNLQLIEGLKAGIDWTILSGDVLRPLGIESDGELAFVGTKIGPVVSYNPIGKLVIDGRLTLQPTAVIAYYDFITYDSQGYSYYGYASGVKFAVRKGLGLSARYNALTAGFELNWGKALMPLVMDIETYDDYYLYDIDVEMKTSRFDLFFGLAF